MSDLMSDSMPHPHPHPHSDSDSDSHDTLPDDDPVLVQRRAVLSALMDGETDGTGVSAGCQAWRDHASARQAWHSYQLIGDVLRSDELAQPSARDRDFLAALRQRLADEPVVLAPAPLMAGAAQPQAATKVSRWRVPSAVTAGFMAVAGVMVLTVAMRSAAPDSQSAAMVSESAAPPSLTLATLPGVSAASSAGATMIRDAQLDAYLNAHRATRAGGATALPGTALLTVDVAVPANAQR